MMFSFAVQGPAGRPGHDRHSAHHDDMIFKTPQLHHCLLLRFSLGEGCPTTAAKEDL